MSALDEAIRGRRSIRQFRPEPVTREAILELIELAAWAPSAGNRQDWLFTVVLSSEIRAEMAAAVRRRWAEIIEANRGQGCIEEVERYAARFADFERAPAVIAVSARRAEAVQRHLVGEAAAATAGGAASAAMAAQNLMLAAHARGLGSCCMTGALAAGAELARLAGLGRREELVCLIALGWPAEQPPAPGRKPPAQIARFLE